MDIYLETGKKRVIAGALEWPGWCRSGRSEAEALQALLDYGLRYAAAIRPSGLKFSAPQSLSDFNIVERLPGDSTTDYGVPGAAPNYDQQPFDAAERKRSEAILQALWSALDVAANAARGKELRKGPRGGGRELDAILRHVLEADVGYLKTTGWKLGPSDVTTLEAAMAETRKAVPQALAAAERGELPERGPRGGLMWNPRYYVRRSAWHTLDHVWEIEDRVVEK